MERNVLIRTIAPATAAIYLMMMIAGFDVIFPQSGLDDAALLAENGEPAAPEKKRAGFSAHIATGIKAEAVLTVKGAVRITWENDPQATGEFIIGRSKAVMDTTDKAVAAVLVRVIGAGAEKSILDTSLPPGEYYYVVLSREKVAEGNVELFPNVNYTTVPVVIEKEAPVKPVRENPDQVTLIHAQLAGNAHVVITWKGVDKPDVVYTVYRGTEPLSSPEKLRSAEKVAVIADRREIFVDRSITKTGTYYYAVSTRDAAGNEDLQLVPEQSYLTGGINAVMRTPLYVRDLRVIPAEEAVRISWSGVGTLAREYLIYRYDKPINDAQRLALASQIGRTGPEADSFIDRQAAPGSNYYAVLVKVDETTVDYTLLERQNFSVEAVEALRKKDPGIVKASKKKIEPEKEPATEPKAEDKLVPEKKAPPPGSVDAIVKSTFLRGRYLAAIKKLEVVAETSDNELEAAKAMLFIGRSLIELKRYSEAIRYFIEPDVKRHFPAEARFWREYAISRVRE